MSIAENPAELKKLLAVREKEVERLKERLATAEAQRKHVTPSSELMEKKRETGEYKL